MNKKFKTFKYLLVLALFLFVFSLEEENIKGDKTGEKIIEKEEMMEIPTKGAKSTNEVNESETILVSSIEVTNEVDEIVLNKKYYYKVRAYIIINNKKYYSSYSKIKSIKIS